MYREGHLLSIGSKTIADVRSELSRPEKAIVIVPGFRHVRILLDKDGSVDSLMQEIKIFEWESLQNAANNYASFSVMNSAEQVHKILNELLKHDELALAYALSELLFRITEAVAVQRGVFVTNVSTYYHQVQESVSLESAWTCYHRLALGLDVEPEKRSVWTRGIAVLYLYRETVSILRPALSSDHLMVAEQAIQVIDETKILLSNAL